MTLFSLLRPNTSGPYADIANAYIAHNLWPFPFPLQLLLIHAKRGGPAAPIFTEGKRSLSTLWHSAT